MKRASTVPAEQKRRIVRSRLFAEQLDFIDDPSRYKTLLCARRSGKTTAALAYLVETCLGRPKANTVLCTLTLKSAKQIAWQMLKDWNQELELGLHFHNTDLIARFANGSKLTLGGAETEADIERYRGQAFDLFIIDEAKSFSARLLDEFVSQVIGPALADRKGVLALTGTPGAILAGTFYEATGPTSSDVELKGKKKTARSRPYSDRAEPKYHGVTFRWSTHAWGKQENIKVPHLWQEALDDKERYNWSDDNPVWIREYLGRWIADDSKLVYRYLPERNDWRPGKKAKENPFGLPDGYTWRYLLGMDLGFSDPTAIVLAAHSDTHPHLFHCYEHVERGLTVREIGEHLQKLLDIVDIEAAVCDWGGLGDTIGATLTEEYGIVFEKAEKKQKRDHIELLNADLIDGKFFVLEGSELSTQMSYLCWDEGGIKEKAGQRNDACDAVVYLWRKAQHHQAKKAEAKPDVGTPEWEVLREEEELHRVVEREKKMNRLDSHEDDSNMDQSDWFQEGDAESW